MKSIWLTILVFILLLSCQKDRLDGLWIAENSFDCPYTIKFSDGFMISNLTGNRQMEMFQYKLFKNKIILNQISYHFSFDQNPDTLKITFSNNHLVIDTFKFIRIKTDENYFNDFLISNSLNLNLPKLKYKITIERCSDNYIIVPKQTSNLLTFIVNGELVTQNDTDKIYKSLLIEDLDTSKYIIRDNSCNFIVDENINYNQLNIIRNYLRRFDIIWNRFLYLPLEKDEFNYLNTYAINIRAIPMSESEMDLFKIRNDSLVNYPTPFPICDYLSDNNYLTLKIINQDLISFENDTLFIEKINEQKINNIIDNKKILVIRVNESIDLKTYLKVYSKIYENLYNIRDSISMSISKKHFDYSIDSEFQDSIYRITNLPIFEIDQLLEIERKKIEKKYGLQQGV